MVEIHGGGEGVLSVRVRRCACEAIENEHERWVRKMVRVSGSTCSNTLAHTL